MDLLTLVVCGVRRSVHEAYQSAGDQFDVDIKSVYNKLNGTEADVSRELVRRPAERLGKVIRQMKATLPPLVEGYRVKIVDGNHFPSTDHRIKELRTTRSGPLPGQALVVLEPELMLATDVIPCEDGHAQERSLLPQLLPQVEQDDLWIADRNFCTTDFLFALADRQAYFAIRQHASTLSWETVGRRRKIGRCQTGVVYEQSVRLSTGTGAEQMVRRVTLHLDKPTRKGDEVMHILTNVPANDVDAIAIAMLYRERWTVENAFQELSDGLNSELNTLGYPKAALLAFSIALLAYNALSVTKAAMRAVHGDNAKPQEISGYYMTGEISAAYHGMMIAIPESEWAAVFGSLKAPSLARLPKEIAGHIQPRRFRKQLPDSYHFVLGRIL